MKKEVQSQRLDMRQHILTVASDLMTEKGIKETSLKDISAKASISKGTLYYYYSAKEDIIYDIADKNLTQITDGLLDWIDHLDTATPVQLILEEVFDKILNATTRGKLHLYLLCEASVMNERITQKFKERYIEWRQILLDGLRKVLNNKNQENYMALSYLIVASLDGLMIQKMFEPDNIPINDIVKLIMSAV